MDTLERDALEVLRLTRSLKNSLTPINRIPPEVLSLLPDYCDELDMDEDSISLTHVCRAWRNTFISRSLLWTHLDFTNTDKTRTYLQRSKSSPLKICLGADNEDETVLEDVVPFVISHIYRLKSLVVRGYALPDVLRYFCHHAPLLEELDVSIVGRRDPVLDSAPFNGDLSSIRKLTLGGVITYFPWKNMANLRVASLGGRDAGHAISRLLNFESAPLLHTVRLEDSLPDSSDAPPERIVSLPHLRVLTIDAGPVHSILLNHLHIPAVTSLTQIFEYGQGIPPLLDNLPQAPADLGNLAHITTINLCFDSTQKLLLLHGPSGSLRAVANLARHKPIPRYDLDPQLFRYLSSPILSTTRGLTVLEYKYFDPAGADRCPAVSQALSSMGNLRTLVLVRCNPLPFVFVLDPRQDSSEPAACPNLWNLTLYIEAWNQFPTKQLITMAKNRASRGAGLSSITIVCPQEFVPGEEMIRLKEYVTHVEYRVGDNLPTWDALPDESK